MARAAVIDLWLRSGAPSSAKRALSQARDPMTARVPNEWRTTAYGRGKRWRVVWYALLSDGARRQQTRAFARREDADEFAAAVETDIRAGKFLDIKAADRSFAAVVEEWLEAKESTVRKSTLYRYKTVAKIHLLPQWGSLPLGAITRGDIQRWVGELTDGTAPTASHRTVVPLAPATVARVLAAMHDVMQLAVDRGWIAGNPCDRISRPKIPQVIDRVYLSAGEIEQAASACEAVRGRASDGTAVRIMGFCGLRIGECMALRVRDVDAQRGRITVRETWAPDGGKEYLSPPKSGRARSVAFPPSMGGELRELCEGRAPDDWLIEAPRGGHISLPGWSRAVWRPAMQRLGWADRGITPHTLRHSFASLAIKAGADVKTLQAQMGHASAKMTLDTYAGLWPDRLDQIADLIGRERDAATAGETPQKS